MDSGSRLADASCAAPMPATPSVVGSCSRFMSSMSSVLYPTVLARLVPVLGFVVLGALLPGCSSDERALSEQARSDLLAWSGVSDHRGTVSAGSDMYLLTVRPGKPLPQNPGPTAQQPCIRAQAFLPGPAHDPRVFYLVDGALHAQHRDGARPGIVTPLSGLDDGLTITDLLAVGKNPARVELLAFVKRAGQKRSNAWLIEIAGDRIAAARAVGRLPALRNKKAFFDRFHVPRCKRGDRRCVAAVPMSGRDSLLVEEPRRGQPGQPISGFDALAAQGIAGVKDVAWVAGDSDALYLAVGCRASTP